MNTGHIIDVIEQHTGHEHLENQISAGFDKVFIHQSDSLQGVTHADQQNDRHYGIDRRQQNVTKQSSTFFLYTIIIAIG
jgi:hypothetical protein